MLGRTHLAVGFLFAVVLQPILIPENVIGYYILVLFGALLPDIDHEGSLVNKIFPVTKIGAKLVSHRGIFHSALMVGILWLGLSVFSFNYSLFLLVGYLSHLVSDSFTKLGVNWFYPFTSIKLHGFLTTGTLAETAVFWICVVFSLVRVFQISLV